MGESYFWKPFAQGVATPIVLIGGTNLLLKNFKDSKPYIYWGGLAASSAVVLGVLADKIKVPILNAETFEAPKSNPPYVIDGKRRLMTWKEQAREIKKVYDYPTWVEADKQIDYLNGIYEYLEGCTDEEFESWFRNIDQPDMHQFAFDYRSIWGDNTDRDKRMNHFQWFIEHLREGKNMFPEEFYDAENDEMNIYQMADIYEKQARFLRPLVEKAIRNGCFDKKTSQEIMDDGNGLGLHLVESDYFRDAESFESEYDNCPVCKGDIYGDMSMIGEEIVPDICGDCDIYIMPKGSDFKVSCMECGYGDFYGSASVCESCETIGEKMNAINKNMNAETFNSDSHTDSFMADMPVNAVKNNDGWYIPSIHRNDYKEVFKNWSPKAYPYEKKITQDSINEACNSCGEEKVHYQFYLARKNSVNPKMRFVDGATYCQYDINDCGGNICGDCAENATCENCGAEICTFCEEENNYEHSDLVCVECREFDESLEDD